MKKLTTFFSICIMLGAFICTHAQNTFPSSGAAGIGTTTPNSSSLLDVVSTSKGVLVPRMTKTQRDAITLPAEGLLIYQTNSTPGFYYYNGSAWAAISSKGANKSLSNLTAPTAVNVDVLPGTAGTLNLGSSANSWKDVYYTGSIYSDGVRAINIDVNNAAAGAYTLSSNTGSFNTAFGNYALNANTTAWSNTAFGYAALRYNTTGSGNTAIGLDALDSNTTGSVNTALGTVALYSNTTGDANTATGNEALLANTTGSDNTTSGNASLRFNTTGSYNTANGYISLYHNTTGNYNTGYGYRTLVNNTTGHSNVAVGTHALNLNTTSSNLVAVGDSALYNNTGSYNTATGSKALYSNTTGSSNTANGYQSLYLNTTGTYNTANGRHSLYSNTTANYNTAHGYRALYANSTGEKNTAVGYGAGSFNDVNTSCSFFGYDADQTVTTDFTNSMALGNTARITAGNQVRLGNSTVTSIGGYASWSNISDGRYKKEIKENVPGLEFINKLKPVTYHLDVHGISKFLGEDITDEEEQKSRAEQGRNEKEKIIYTGFIAQDVEQAAKEIGYDFSGVDKPQNENSLYGLRYAEFVVPLVKSVQELDSINRIKNERVTSLENENIAQQKQIDDLRSQVAQLLSFNSPGNDGFAKLQIQDSNTETVLGQNIPNPFDNSTIIPFRIPKACNGASIVIAESATGRIVTAIPIICSETHIAVEAGNLASGSYSYSLYVDGKMIDTKTMLLTK